MKKMFKNQLVKSRIEKANRLKGMGLNPFPNASDLKYVKDIKDIFSFTQLSTGETEFVIAGRVRLLRKMGKSGFIHIEDETSKVQAFLSLDNLGDNFKVFKNMLDIGDFVILKGFSFFTKSEEFTMKVNDIQISSKALHPLPEKHHGLEDVETRYRKRYLDMIVNKEVVSTFKIRSLIIKKLRNILSNFDFLEVETPVLNPIPGGANARPFVTHFNALDVERYLRIAPELYLKRLIVGGLPRVFEIGKQFRNEGLDATHNPEFTSLEFYQAYSTYIEHMDFIEDIFKKILKEISPFRRQMGLDYEDGLFSYGEHKIDFNNWQKYTFRDVLIEIGNISEENIDTIEGMSDVISYLTGESKEELMCLPLGKLWEKAFDETVEEKLIDPTYIIDYPADISPLARRKDSDPTLTERFELFIAGREFANGFNELNDPIDQYERFLSQVESKDSDDEAMFMDKNFVEALMYSMPPTAGTGIGIDRLVMLFTNSPTIKDVIIYPAMK